MHSPNFDLGSNPPLVAVISTNRFSTAVQPAAPSALLMNLSPVKAVESCRSSRAAGSLSPETDVKRLETEASRFFMKLIRLAFSLFPRFDVSGDDPVTEPRSLLFSVSHSQSVTSKLSLSVDSSKTKMMIRWNNFFLVSQVNALAGLKRKRKKMVRKVQMK